MLKDPNNSTRFCLNKIIEQKKEQAIEDKEEGRTAVPSNSDDVDQIDSSSKKD